MRLTKILLFFLIQLPIAWVAAQGTVEDYRRAEAFDSLFTAKAYKYPKAFHWLKTGDKFWYLNPTREGKEFIMTDVKKRAQGPAFDHGRLAKVLSQKLAKEIDQKALPFEKIDFSDDLKSMVFHIDSANFKFNLSSYQCEITIDSARKEDGRPYWGEGFDESGNEPMPSPDKNWVAFIKDNNVFIRSEANKELQLSYDGSGGNFYSSYMEWSPDSKKLMAYKVKPGDKRQIYFIESSPKDQLQPKLCSRAYLKPGDELPHKQPQLFLVDEKKHIPLSDALYQHQYSLENIYWRKDSRSFTFEYNERGHQRYRIIEVTTSGEIRVLIDEKSETFIDYSGKKFRHDVDDGKEIIWASERDGWNHLYLVDGITGKIKTQITSGQWVVRKVIHVDEKNRQLIFSASGLDKDQDPYLLQYCKINFDGSGFIRLTNTMANHNATFSEDYNYFIDQYSRIDLAPVSKLCRASDGKEIMTIQEADITDLEKNGWKRPEVFSAKGRDGKTDIWGMIIRPTNFDPEKKYPVIEFIYAGPHGFFVPKNFNPNYRGLHALAELGFIVVQIDGMGTSGRSKAFQDVCWKNLKDAGFADRIAWLQEAASKYPYMDISRVGIFGGSAGGQSAAGAVLFHPEFYKVAVASCGCHDNRMDKLWWNEQWMGYPIGPHYAESSNVVNAHRLQGKLMLILGELDDNVDPASTMQFADALIKSKKDFELVVVPGMGHSLGGEYGDRKRKDFFVKHLLGIEPPLWINSYQHAVGRTKSF